ncbi:MAG: outer membrane protein assembly factor BamA, partial [Bdellovibrionales bacterium]
MTQTIFPLALPLRLRTFLKAGSAPLFILALCLNASPARALSDSPLLEPEVEASSVPMVDEATPEENGPVITGIDVQGAQRLERDTVLSYLTVAKGDTATREKLNASLKALYATGLFADIHLSMQGDTLEVKVTENPIVSRVTYEGNDAISTEDLEKEVQLKPRLVYTLPKVQSDVQRVLDLYRRSGRFAATVDPKIVPLDQNRVDVIFEIVEGSHTGVRRIKFVGNDHFDEAELRGVINTEETAWWKVFSNADFYDPDRTNYDRELLRRFYMNEGYVDFRVVSAVAEMTPDREDFFLTFTVDEGQRYKFGKISITNEIKGLNEADLKPYLTTLQGEWYSADRVEKTIAKLTAVLGDKQYAFVSIEPEVDKHKDQKTVDITYHIKPGERDFIDRIDIAGNTRTIDRVI